ncbi:hypothetical protein AB3S75_000129 [Citrus x aurantiifolia]
MKASDILRDALDLSDIKEKLCLKFKLPDGTEIGPFTYSPVDSVAHLKSSVVSNWPKDIANGLKKAKYVDLFKGENILPDDMDLSDMVGAHYSEEIITIKVVLRSPSNKSKDSAKATRGVCAIL